MLQTTTIPIGRLAAATGCKVQTIRYYEQIGLLPEPPRTAGDQRRYGALHQHRLTFIRHARELGFPLPAIRELLRLADQRESDCTEADRIASEQLTAVRRGVSPCWKGWAKNSNACSPNVAAVALANAG